jgi:hypothetical protein
VRKADLLAHLESLQETFHAQFAEQRLLIADLRARVEMQERRTQELQLRTQQRLSALEQAHEAELSLLVEARQRQQQKLTQLQHAVETHKQQLQSLDTVLG